MSLVVRQAPCKIYCTLTGKCRLHLQNFPRGLCSKTFPDVAVHKPEPIKYLNNKIAEIVKWYEEFSGLKEVMMAQRRVVEAGDALAKIQEERRQAAQAVTDIQRKLKEIYAALDNTKRGDDRYVYLITEEHKLLKEEEARQEKFRDAEKAEREQFSILTNAVKNSHEKERTQAEKTKYWSIIGSVIGTIIGIIGTSINNYFRMSEIKKLIRESSNGDLKEQLKTYIENSEKIVKDVTQVSASSVGNSERNKSVEDLLNTLNSRLINVEGSVKNIESTRNGGVANVQFNPDSEDSELLVLHFNSLTESIQRENKQIKALLVSASILCILVPIISKVLSV